MRSLILFISLVSPDQMSSSLLDSREESGHVCFADDFSGLACSFFAFMMMVFVGFLSVEVYSLFPNLIDR